MNEHGGQGHRTVVVWTIAVICAVTNWLSRALERRWLEWVSKPATTATLLTLALLSGTPSPKQKALVVAGLVFCLLGDVFLMLPRDRFLAGLVSFLIAHLLFLAGFVARGHVAPWWSVALLVCIAVSCAAVTILKVVPAVRSDASTLFLPVIVYSTVILLMGASSVLGETAYAPLGTAVFMSSDMTLGHERFVRPSRVSSVAVMVTYHIALALIVLSLRA